MAEVGQIFPIRLHRRAGLTATARERKQRARQATDGVPALATVSITLDGRQYEVAAGSSLLDAAREAGVFIPALCAHPELPPACSEADDWGGCGLCLVAVGDEAGEAGEAELQRACQLAVTEGMQVVSQNPLISRARQQALARTLAHHPHVCLTCPQRDGCSRVTCSFGHPVATRCCEIFNHCELRKLADHVVIPPDTPDYRPQRYVRPQPLPVVKDEPFYDRDYNLCIDCRRCLVACNEVRGVGCLEAKEEADGRRWVGPIADTLLASGCMFCNACVEVCPTGALIDRTQTAEQRQAGQVPCATACPAGIDVPRYVQLAGLGRFAEAHAVVREKLPFPGILGRACYAPCETDCRRSHLDDPLSIRSLKRIASEHDDGRWRELQRRLPPTNKQVAVIGAGPAGLTAAFYLAKQGHAVTVFEAQAEAGGMARHGIPAYRLPREVIKAEVAEVAHVGVAFRFNTRIDGLQAPELQQADAVFIAIGAQQGKPLDAAKPQPGAMEGVMDGVDFLRAVARSEIDRLPDSVTVIGGGDVACDAARSALRLGAASVEMVYRGSQERLRAHPAELEAGLEEGVRLRLQSTLREVARESESERESERAALQLRWQVAGTNIPAPAQPPAAQTHLLISAIGQQVAGLSGLALSAAGLLEVDDGLRLRGQHKVFAGGDAVTGPASLIEAVAQGRQAASAIDRFLGGDGRIDEVLLDAPWRDWQTPDNIARTRIGEDETHRRHSQDFNQRHAVTAPRLVVSERQGWAEVEHCYPVTDACAEGLRCLKCNLMHEMQAAELPPDARQPLTAASLAAAPAESGVYFIFDAGHTLRAIKGVANLQAGLQEALEQVALQDGAKAYTYTYRLEIAHFYSQRENELLQAYCEQHGRLPPGIGDDELDELF